MGLENSKLLLPHTLVKISSEDSATPSCYLDVRCSTVRRKILHVAAESKNKLAPNAFMGYNDRNLVSDLITKSCNHNIFTSNIG